MTAATDAGWTEVLAVSCTVRRTASKHYHEIGRKASRLDHPVISDCAAPFEPPQKSCGARRGGAAPNGSSRQPPCASQTPGGAAGPTLRVLRSAVMVSPAGLFLYTDSEAGTAPSGGLPHVSEGLS